MHRMVGPLVVARAVGMFVELGIQRGAQQQALPGQAGLGRQGLGQLRDGVPVTQRSAVEAVFQLVLQLPMLLGLGATTIQLSMRHST